MEVLQKELTDLEHYRVLEFSDVRGLLCSLGGKRNEDIFQQKALSRMEFHAFYCPTESWIEMGRPRSNPWEPGVIKRHCAVDHDRDVFAKYGSIRNKITNHTGMCIFLTAALCD